MLLAAPLIASQTSAVDAPCDAADTIEGNNERRFGDWSHHDPPAIAGDR
jgi:hypothetical protein